jgi:hypothetical protein
MALPEQIRKQTEAVQELYKQLNGDDNQGTDNPAANGDGASTNEPSNEPSADGANNPNDATPPQGNEPTPSGTSSDETLNQKYKTLQGMYNAEVPRLHAQNREMQSRVQQLEQLLSSISAQQSAPTPQFQGDPLVTDKDVEEYGDSIDVMRKVTRDELHPVAAKIAQLDSLIRQLQTNVVPQVQAVAQRQAATADQQFWNDLTGIVPNWQDINNDQNFQGWLLEVDPLTGISRQTYLEDAQRNLDVRRVGSFFNTWLNLSGQSASAQPNRNSQSSELQKQVAPGRSRSGNAPGASTARTYSPDDIKAFFNDVRSGKYKGRETERDRLERDIFAAQRDGRIVNA